MSKLKADALSNLAGTAETAMLNAIHGSAKAWVNFTGSASPITINASHNISSITDNGVGDYTVNFATALADDKFAWTCGAGVGSTSSLACATENSTGRTSSTLRFYGAAMIGSTLSKVDYVWANFVAHR